jgi:tRNA-2-methylthio-N6-dimethylallyladenosine synthase
MARKIRENISIPDSKEARNRKSKLINYLNYSDNSDNSHIGEGKTFLIETHGCQANFLDEESIKAILVSSGFSSVSNKEEADLIIINTCSVRHTAENKVFGEIGRLKSLKDIKPNLVIALCGCMAQLQNNIKLIEEKYPQIDLIFGTGEIPHLLSNLNKVYNEKKRVFDVSSKLDNVYDDLPRVLPYKHKAYVNIMYGCDEFCTYCIVPLTRGKERSRKPESIISEITQLIANGCQEVTLLGQNVNAYGQDLNDNYNFSKLLIAISDLNIPRIRFVTSHPRDFTEDLIQLMIDRKNIMPHLHLPMQSGSDRILKLMNRHYSIEDYRQIVNKLNSKSPFVSLTTDIIVGFPDETEEEFNETLKVYEEFNFSGGYNFIFSPRKDTPAYSFTPQIEEKEKKRRHKILTDLSNRLSIEYNTKLVGKEVLVLVDEKATKNDDMTYCGYTEDNRLVNFVGTQDLIGKIVKLKIISTKTWFLFGELVK